ADGGYSRPVWADRRSTQPAYEDRPDPAVKSVRYRHSAGLFSFLPMFCQICVPLARDSFYRGEMLSVGSCRQHAISACHSRQITLVHALNLAQNGWETSDMRKLMLAGALLA